MFFKSKKPSGKTIEGGATPDAAESAEQGKAKDVAPSGSMPPPSGVARSERTVEKPAEAAVKKNLTAEEAKRSAIYSHGVMQALGSIVTVFLRSPAHRKLTLEAVERVVAPAVSTGQFSIAEATDRRSGLKTPVAVVLWASVSPEVDARLQAQSEQALQLDPKDWKSGQIVWIVEVVGKAAVVKEVINKLKTTAWKGRPVRVRTRDQAGKRSVQTLR